MSKVKMISPAVPNMPWQDRADGKTTGVSDAPIWRYSENPIIGRNPVKGVARIFNSAVMPYEGAFIGVFRGEQTNGIPYIYLGRSQDAIHWDFEADKIAFVDEEGNVFGTEIKKVTKAHALRTRSFRLTGMRCCSRARSAATSCC